VAKKLRIRTVYYTLSLNNNANTAIPAFIRKFITENPKLDSIINNVGIQRPFNRNDMNLAKVDQEIAINVQDPLHLSVRLLEYFTSKHTATSLNVSSVVV
jgi:short-subunit dehydrogenase involved in D-alanine esterification of teichoic acids